MVARFALPTEEVVAWCRWAWRDVCIPTGDRTVQKGRDLRRSSRNCTLRAIVPVGMALIAVASATHALSPAATDTVEPKIDIGAFVRHSRLNAHAGDYAWLTRAQRTGYEPLGDRIAPPDGFRRVMVPDGSFADWLRYLPVLPVGAPVCAAGGRTLLAGDAPELAAVIALAPNTEALGSAGMMLRLRAEYAWHANRLERLAFHFETGQRMSWQAWASGIRALNGSDGVRFEKTGTESDDRESFCAWMETQLQFTSCASLLDDTRPIGDGTIATGDVFLVNGRKGHAMMVLDVAVSDDGDVAVLLGGGGTPARSLHVLNGDGVSPWIRLSKNSSESFRVGNHAMGLSDLRRWWTGSHSR